MLSHYLGNIDQEKEALQAFITRMVQLERCFSRTLVKLNNLKVWNRSLSVCLLTSYDESLTTSQTYSILDT